jgi:GT2 family glycosyltransferase
MSLYAQEGFVFGDDVLVHITDNSSEDNTVSQVTEVIREGVSLSCNKENLGFSAAHNQGVHRAVVGKFTHILVLNPDVALKPNCLRLLMSQFCKDPEIGSVTPKLLRADNNLEPLEPFILDAAGMVLESSLRHFDRGAGDIDAGQFEDDAFVFGGTGACLLISVECAWSVALPASSKRDGLYDIYPQLERDVTPRVQLFDEAFFAYREDADLAWRCRRLGWKCLYTPSAVAMHVRVVTPERRSDLPPDLNLYGVRNRFLLQLNNWSLKCGFSTLIWGVLLRNFLVVVGVVAKERSSLRAFSDVFALMRRALTLRAEIGRRIVDVRSRSTVVKLSELNGSASSPCPVNR